MRKILIPTLLIFSFFCSLPAQEQITVSVVNEDTGEPVSGARVQSGGVEKITNARGRVRVRPDVRQLTVTHPGYERVVVGMDGVRGGALEIRLTPRVFSGTVVISGASKRSQSMSDSAARVEQLSREQVELQNPQTAADLLDTAESVYIQKSQMGGGSPMIRGFSTSRVLLVVDGIRMNNAIFRSGNVHNVISLDPNMIDNTEIVYGPGSVIYGSDAIGGVMSFNTWLPDFAREGVEAEGNVFSRYSTVNNEFSNSFRAGAAGRDWSMALSGTVNSFGDLEMGSNGFPEYRRLQYVIPAPGNDQIIDNLNPEVQRFTGYDQANISAKGSLRLTSDLTATAAIVSSETSDIPRYDRLIETSNGTFRNAEWYYGPQVWDVGWLRLDYGRENTFFDNATLTLSRQHFEESRHDRRLNSFVLRNRYEEVDTYGFNLDLDRFVTDRLDMFYGVEYLVNRVGSRANQLHTGTGSRVPISTRYPDGSRWRSAAGYVSAVYHLNPKLTLNAGLRYTSVAIDGELDLRFFPFPFSSIDLETASWTGSTGLTYALSSSTMLFANLGTGFRAPNIDDVAKVFDSEPGAVVVPNPGLESEYVITGDVGLLYLLPNGGQFSANVYYTTLFDAMVRRDSRFGGKEFIEYDGELSRVQAIINAEEATVRGFESTFEMPLTSWLSARASVNFIAGETGAGEPLRHVPPDFGTFQAIFTHGGVLTNLIVNWNSEVSASELAPSEAGKPHLYALDGDGRPYSPGWTVVDLKSTYHINDELHLFFGIENVLDDRYRPYSSGIVAAGRNLFFAIKRTF